MVHIFSSIISACSPISKNDCLPSFQRNDGKIVSFPLSETSVSKFSINFFSISTKTPPPLEIVASKNEDFKSITSRGSRERTIHCPPEKSMVNLSVKVTFGSFHFPYMRSFPCWKLKSEFSSLVVMTHLSHHVGISRMSCHPLSSI